MRLNSALAGAAAMRNESGGNWADSIADQNVLRPASEPYFVVPILPAFTSEKLHLPAYVFGVPMPVHWSKPVPHCEAPWVMSLKSAAYWVEFARSLYIMVSSYRLDFALCPAALTIPAKVGDPQLVPPTEYHAP